MRHQPVVVSVTLIGTALSIFLMMVVIITLQIGTMPFAPESNRPRMLYGENIEIERIDGSGSSSAWLSYNTAKFLYENLDGIERYSYFTKYPWQSDVIGPTGEIFSCNNRGTDAEFWKIYDHELKQGRYYTPEEVASGSLVTVVTESTARRMCGATNPINTRVKIDQVDRTIIGVVADHSRLATCASGDVFTPVDINDNYDEFGSIAVALLKKHGVDDNYIRDQVKGRYAHLATRLAESGRRPVYHEQPYDQETIFNCTYGSNGTPDIKSIRKERAISLLVLLLLPAINLSSMLNSRIRRRIGEFGIRRAFGCTRRRLYTDIVTENLLMTLIGGVVGLVLSLVFAYSYSGLFASGWDPVFETPEVSMLLNWRIIGAALLVCFILNLISASVPALKGCRLKTVNAINATK